MKLLTYTFLLLTFTISFNCFTQEVRITPLSDTLRPITTLSTANRPLKVALKIQTLTHYLPLSYWSKKTV